MQIGKPITLRVEAHANPPPVYQWFRVHRERKTTHVVDNGAQAVLHVSDIHVLGQVYEQTEYCGGFSPVTHKI